MLRVRSRKVYFHFAGFLFFLDVSKERKLLVDPTKSEEDDALAVVDLVFDKDQNIISSKCKGQFNNADE